MSNLYFALAGSLQFRQQEATGARVLVPTKLFEAGPYPDRGVTITESDLDALMIRFNLGGTEVPIRVEHIETPLDPFGHVVALHREGKFLFGTLAFAPGVYSHIVERKADRVSVGLHVVEDEHGKGYSLRECSLVFSSRVPGAGFLSPEQIVAKLSHYRAAGKVTPAMEPAVSRLFSLPGSLNFSDGGDAEALTAGIDALFASMPVVLARGPAVGGVAFSNRTEPEPLSPEMQKWCQMAGIDPAKVAKIKGGL